MAYVYAACTLLILAVHSDFQILSSYTLLLKFPGLMNPQITHIAIAGMTSQIGMV